MVAVAEVALEAVDSAGYATVAALAEAWVVAMVAARKRARAMAETAAEGPTWVGMLAMNWAAAWATACAAVALAALAASVLEMARAG